MAKYILSKTPKGKKFQYTVTDENGNILSKRLSNRDNYVACTANGEFYFGRLDLIGKGDHGKRLSAAIAFLANPEKAYKDWLAYFVPTERIKQKEELPFEQFVAKRTPYYTEIKEELNKIAYIQP